MMNTYNEINRLHQMLLDAEIPHEFSPYMGGHHIIYSRNGQRVCSAIEHDYSYGHEYDTIEIMGLLTAEEAERDSVVGWLSAAEVFNRINADYTAHLQKSLASCTIIGAGGEEWHGHMPTWD